METSVELPLALRSTLPLAGGLAVVAVSLLPAEPRPTKSTTVDPASLYKTAELLAAKCPLVEYSLSADADAADSGEVTKKNPCAGMVPERLATKFDCVPDSVFLVSRQPLKSTALPVGL
jgi:hypothetical protein